MSASSSRAACMQPRKAMDDQPCIHAAQNLMSSLSALRMRSCLSSLLQAQRDPTLLSSSRSVCSTLKQWSFSSRLHELADISGTRHSGPALCCRGCVSTRDTSGTDLPTGSKDFGFFDISILSSKHRCLPRASVSSNRVRAVVRHFVERDL